MRIFLILICLSGCAYTPPYDEAMKVLNDARPAKSRAIPYPIYVINNDGIYLPQQMKHEDLE